MKECRHREKDRVAVDVAALEIKIHVVTLPIFDFEYAMLLFVYFLDK